MNPTMATRGNPSISKLAPALALTLAFGCAEPAAPAITGEVAAPAQTSAALVASATRQVTSPVELHPAFSAAEFRALMDRLSEPDADFFSDNFISNETSYLQVTRLLEERPPGGVYIGVGPEQNFTYLALTRPETAYVVDIRRDNLVLQLLYKAAFDLASSRAHFLALLTSRPYRATGDPGATGTLEQVLAHAESQPTNAEAFRLGLATMRQRIEDGYGIPLDEKDAATLERSHRAFYRGGLDLKFELKEDSVRKYPTFREILGERDPDGRRRGFLASEEDFRFVQRMQRENRIVPLVGNFAGDRALPELGKHLSARGEIVRSFYVSNVEQYLMVDGVWWKWRRNIAALPTDDRSVFIRAYLDQGKRHPKQMEGHRTTTTLQRIADFNERDRPYPSMLALATDRVLAAR